jgi:4-carboxymuconolactone decarboxylase
MKRTLFALVFVWGVAMSASAQDRMPPIPADRLTEAQRREVAAFEAARMASVSGPFWPLLRSPELMTRVRAIGDYLRFGGILEPRLREFVILITARQWSQQYEWYAHHSIAMEAGLSPSVAQALADGRRPEGMRPDEALLYDFCQELHTRRSVSDDTYARAVSAFGEQGVMDVVGLSGYYTMLAMVLNTARTPLPAGRQPELPLFPR